MNLLSRNPGSAPGYEQPGPDVTRPEDSLSRELAHTLCIFSFLF